MIRFVRLAALPRSIAAGVVALSFLVLALTLARPAAAAVTGKIQGKVVATDTGEPLGFADVLLIPADTTTRKIGAQTNVDGTFLLEAPVGRYAIQIRMLSYATKRVEGIQITEGKLLPFTTGLSPDAIQQEEIVVEAKAKQNTENSMLAARKKAAAVGNAVSAEQVRKSPDKDAAEVLRRVTGLSVSDGKYVFVRGLGERYSSTEVDGVRIASPEQNKRVVPLDLLPASLLENIVVQKTYTADRPGEFGGGDVQVHTKDFPGDRTWSFAISQGYVEGLTFQQRRTYASSRADIFGFGADSRRIPDEVFEIAGNRQLREGDPARGLFTRSQLAELAKSFPNIWSPNTVRALPNASYQATYGDEFKFLGRSLGLIASGSLSRGYDEQQESQRYFAGAADTIIDYAVQRSTESVQLGGISALSYRLSPRNTIHLRGLYTHSADDEVRTYEGYNFTGPEQYTGESQRLRATRLMYVERQIVSGTLEGQHEIAQLLNTSLNWKLTRSGATREQPDRRETVYSHNYYDDGTGNLVAYWAMGPVGTREYGDLHDQGWGGTITGAVPYKLGALGSGKMTMGFDRQTKKRDNLYRRYNIVSKQDVDNTAPPESVLADPDYVTEITFAVDNYQARQRVTSAFTSFDVPFGKRVRGNFGVRMEEGFEDVRSYDLFNPTLTTAEGKLDDTDWLPSGNLTWAVSEALNVRLGASRTLSRPDINELSPSATTEFIGGLQLVGNPNLHRAVIENYDLRVEVFPGLSEVLAAGVFYKDLHEPIEQAIRGGSPGILLPVNSKGGTNQGVELEARFGFARLRKSLSPLAINANASLIDSKIDLKPEDSHFGSGTHPLQGQANYLVNTALTYNAARGGIESAVLLSVNGKRLRALGSTNLPDIYEQPSASLDATLGIALGRTGRMKFAARNVLDPNIQQLQAGKEVSAYQRGRSYSVQFSMGQ